MSYKNGILEGGEPPTSRRQSSDEMFQLQRLQRPGGVLVALVALASLATLVGSSPSPLSASASPFASASHPAVPVSSSHGARAPASPFAPAPDQNTNNNWSGLGLGRRANVPIPDPASRVDLFIGTTSTGHAFPGEPPPPSLSLWLTICGRFRFCC